MDVLVVGGGVIGLCIAEALERHGAAVSVLEAERCGGQASTGNNGWVTPGLSIPVPEPGTMTRALRWMFNPASPLLVHPSFLVRDPRWSYCFWRQTTPARFGAGMAALVALNEGTLDGFDALAAAGVEFELHRDGLLLVAREEAALEKELKTLRQQQALGYRGTVTVLDREAVRELEPALAASVAGGILAADERHLRPESLTAGLQRHLERRGVAIREGARAVRISSSGAGWTVDLAESDERLEAERLVLAMGVSSATLLRPLGVRLPLTGGKGYSVTERQPSIRPRRPLHLLETKVGISPFADGVRLAGTMELGATDLRLRPRRLRALDFAAERYLTGWEPSRDRLRWAGFRPLLPDGLPAIGPVPGRDGLFVATGHSMLGVTLAPASAEALAPLVLDLPGPSRLAPFSLARFANLG